MYRIAMMPMTERGKITLFATTSEWLRFIDHLRNTQRGALANLVMGQINAASSTNKVTLPEVHARQLLRYAGVSA